MTESLTRQAQNYLNKTEILILKHPVFELLKKLLVSWYLQRKLAPNLDLAKTFLVILWFPYKNICRGWGRISTIHALKPFCLQLACVLLLQYSSTLNKRGQKITLLATMRCLKTDIKSLFKCVKPNTQWKPTAISSGVVATVHWTQVWKTSLKSERDRWSPRTLDSSNLLSACIYAGVYCNWVKVRVWTERDL